MDSLWGDAYNQCNEARLDSLISDDLEFYHDRGGLNTSKKLLTEIYQKNVCGKVKRELLKGSLEVYSIPNFGAVEIGRHGFYTNEEEHKNIRYARFVHVWKNQNGKWEITRVISLH
jgi:hypothetical protein